MSSFARTLSLLPFVLLLVAMSGCSRERWLGTVYPDKNDLLEYKHIGEYSSLNECLQAVNAAAGEAGSYECGLNCKESSTGSGIMICKTTVGNEK